MSSVNKVILIGRLGSDPDVRTTGSGQMVANMRLATSETFNDKAGQRQERTEWHTVVCWGKTAELAQRYLTKGRQVYVEGRLATRSWEDQQTGAKRYSTEIVCSQLTFLDSGAGGGERPSRGGAAAPAGGGEPEFDLPDGF